MGQDFEAHHLIWFGRVGRVFEAHHSDFPEAPFHAPSDPPRRRRRPHRRPGRDAHCRARQPARRCRRPDAKRTEDKVKIDKETKKAIDKALRFLAKRQDSDGSWGNTAITGFALLAFMANGHVPNQGDYGKVVAKGVRYLLASRARGRLPRRHVAAATCTATAWPRWPSPRSSA